MKWGGGGHPCPWKLPTGAQSNGLGQGWAWSQKAWICFLPVCLNSTLDAEDQETLARASVSKTLCSFDFQV